jgi:hypothetical protein
VPENVKKTSSGRTCRTCFLDGQRERNRKHRNKLKGLVSA